MTPSDDLDPDEFGRWLAEQYPADDAPREPGKWKVQVGGDPHSFDDRLTCEHCGRTIHATGVMFGDGPPCSQHPDMVRCIPLHAHQGDNCPYWRFRLWRLWHRHTWGRVERRMQTWKWRRRMRAERRDPNAWLDYWSKDDDG